MADNKFKNHSINFSHVCLCSDKVAGMPLEGFCFDFVLVDHVAPIFAVSTGTTISCSLGGKYGPVLCISFFDVYALLH